MHERFFPKFSVLICIRCEHVRKIGAFMLPKFGVKSSNLNQIRTNIGLLVSII